MFVASVFVTPLMDVSEEIMLIANVDILATEYVIVHRYQPSLPHGVIVGDMTPLELATWPLSRLKFA
jgi:hypothetical protein